MSGTISTIIPSLHSPMIDRVILALRSQTVPTQEIIVVGQDRYGLVPADVTFIQTKVPISAAAARNLGAQHASSDYLLFMDSDCLACPQLIERLLACHSQGLYIVGGGVAPESDSYWAYCDNLLVFADVLHTAAAGERSLLPSLNFSLPRMLFMELGGFDQCYPGAAGEDLDLSLRLRSAGYHLHFAPDAWVAHQHQRSTARSVWEHLRGFGRVHVRVQQQHATLMPSALQSLSQAWAPLLRIAAPFLALLDIMRLCLKPIFFSFFAAEGSHKREKSGRRQGYGSCRCRYNCLLAAPGMIWAKSGWYWGVADALEQMA